MIMYNTTMGICAGAGLILLAILVRRIGLAAGGGEETTVPFDHKMWAATMAALGLPLALLGGLMATTWPLNVNPPLNILMGEPSFLFGVLLLAGALYLARYRGTLADLSRADLTPLSVVVGIVGAVMIFSGLAIVRFGIVGAAPVVEPITGQLNGFPHIENTFFALLYLAAGVGAVIAALNKFASPTMLRVVYWVWLLDGLVFAAFSALNFYTHAGLVWNLENGTTYRW